jgi:hypothetical protein
MHFRGQASRSTDDAMVLKTASSGTSCTMKTIVGPKGIETTLEPAAGDLAFAECVFHMTSDHAFTGSGTLVFGEDGENAIHFSTMHPGHIGPPVAPGVLAGTASWRVDGGSGRFAAAAGLITSAFTLRESGELSEYQCGLIFIPES